MQIITPLELSYEQLKAFIRKRPPRPIREAINKSWVSEKKAKEEEDYVKRTRVEPRNSQFIDDIRQCGN
jgi:hypothetical protein